MLKKLAAGLAAVVLDLVGVREVVLGAGTACLARGLYDIYPPAAWIAVGVVLMLLALRTRRSE